MRIKESFRRLTAWITCFAILLSSLAPSISHAVAAHNGVESAFLEICTSTGTKQIKLDNQVSNQVTSQVSNEQAVALQADEAQIVTAPASGKKVDHSGHCPFCLTHAGSFGILASQSFVFPVVAGTYEMPALFYQSSRPLYAWASSQPRAPPIAS